MSISESGPEGSRPGAASTRFPGILVGSIRLEKGVQGDRVGTVHSELLGPKADGRTGPGKGEELNHVFVLWRHSCG